MACGHLTSELRVIDPMGTGWLSSRGGGDRPGLGGRRVLMSHEGKVGWDSLLSAPLSPAGVLHLKNSYSIQKIEKNNIG